MQPPARVTSLDLLRDFHAALATFRADGQDALTTAALDVRRAFDWLDERRQFWARQVRARQDEVTHAKTELGRKKWVLPGDRQPDVTEEVKALRLAQLRLEEAEQKVEACRRWQPALQRAVDEYAGPVRHLADVLEAGVPKAMALLTRQITDLEAYLAVAPHVARSSPPARPAEPPAERSQS